MEPFPGVIEVRKAFFDFMPDTGLGKCHWKAPLLLAASHYGGGLRNMRGVGRTVGWVQALLEALCLRPPLAAESCLKWRWRQLSAL